MPSYINKYLDEDVSENEIILTGNSSSVFFMVKSKEGRGTFFVLKR